MLQAGYLEDWTFNATLSGTPQGGVVSPILCNIYLSKLDEFVEQQLIPQYTRGSTRRENLEHGRHRSARYRARKKGDREQARQHLARMRKMPALDPFDPGYRRLTYSRYADDTLLGFSGPRAEAEQIKQKLADFMRNDLRLTMSEDKTLITHARSGAARFLGYEITVRHSKTGSRRGINGDIALRVPLDVIKTACRPYLRHGKPAAQQALLSQDDYSIVSWFGAKYRGLVQYYMLAYDVYRFHRLQWVMQTSMLKTLAQKHHSSVVKMAARHRTKIETPQGKRRCYQATRHRGQARTPLTATFGGIPLKQRRHAVITDRDPRRASTPPGSHLITPLQRWRCELCEHDGTVEVHHVAKLADLGKPGPAQPPWATQMAKTRRKTLVVCQACHQLIHNDRAITA